jgi:hypothetical protein
MTMQGIRTETKSAQHSIAAIKMEPLPNGAQIQSNKKCVSVQETEIPEDLFTFIVMFTDL